jgi:hypothetical protein
MGAALALVVARMLGGAVMTAIAVLDGMRIAIDVGSAIGELMPGG